MSGQMQRCVSTLTDGEDRIAKILKEKFPSASSLKVVDISGKQIHLVIGCSYIMGVTYYYLARATMKHFSEVAKLVKQLFNIYTGFLFLFSLQGQVHSFSNLS